MSEKLDKLRASLEKERERRIKINTRIESLERRIQEAEAAEVNEMVRTAKVTPEQLAALLRQSATATPNPAALSAVGATFEKEGSKLFRCDLCGPHHFVDLGGILLLNAPFQNLDAVVQLDAAFLLFFQHRPQLIRFFAHSNSSNHFESRPNPARCFSQ